MHKLRRFSLTGPWALLVACGLALAMRLLGLDASAAQPAGSALGRAPSEARRLPAGSYPRSAELLLQDAELVYGPGEASFDLAGTIARRPDLFGGRPGLAGTIGRIALEHSISPRLLLALFSLGDPSAAGGTEAYLNQAAAWLADGYYGIKYRDERLIRFADGSTVAGELSAGAAHFALTRLLAREVGQAAWPDRHQAFVSRYTELYGAQPWLDQPLPGDLRQPRLLLPWAAGQTWHYTGGPHGSWGVASAWGAVDFAPPSRVGCGVAPEWVLAAAPGLILHTEGGLVLQDLDGDGDPGTGWLLAYLHLSSRDRVQAGVSVTTGDPLGHPSCEGGVADGAHLHFARRYGGEWLPAADGPAPMALSGWAFQSLGNEYDGSMEHPELGLRLAVTSRRGGDSAVLSDNGVEQRGALTGVPAEDRTVTAPEPGAGGELTLAVLASPSAVATEAEAEADWTQVTRDGSAAAAATAVPAPPETGPALRLRMAARGAGSASAVVTLQVLRGGTVILSRSLPLDEAGYSPSVKLEAIGDQPVDLVVSQPGMLRQSAFAVAIGADLTLVDFSLDGLALAPVGDLDGDGWISLADLGAWPEQARQRRAQADLSGDGDTDLSDLWQLVGAVARR